MLCMLCEKERKERGSVKERQGRCARTNVPHRALDALPPSAPVMLRASYHTFTHTHSQHSLSHTHTTACELFDRLLFCTLLLFVSMILATNIRTWLKRKSVATLGLYYVTVCHASFPFPVPQAGGNFWLC